MWESINFNLHADNVTPLFPCTLVTDDLNLVTASFSRWFCDVFHTTL